MRGNISGKQSIEYNGGDAYSIPAGQKVPADTYSPRLIAKVLRAPYSTRIKYFQVRTRTTVNMTTKMRFNLALMGGSGALFAALVSDKTTEIYTSCVNACPKGYTLRAFMFPLLRAGLAAKDSTIVIASGVFITNPWVYNGTQTLQLPANIISKFQNELS